MRTMTVTTLLVVVLLTGVVPLTAVGEANIVPLPKLSSAPIEMRVAYVVNSRLPRMSDQQVAALLVAAADTARDQFGAELRFAPVVVVPIEDLFARMIEKRADAQRSLIYDFKSGQGDFERFVASFAEDLRSLGNTLEEITAFVRPYIGDAKVDSYEVLARVLARVQLERLEQWRTLKALDGKPVIDATPYNEFQMWLALGYSDIPFEFLLTNQVIASVEYKFSTAHSAIRGGYTNGITTYSKESRLGTVTIWSTFAFTTNDPWVVQMRGGERYTAEEAARLAGIGATHEIGHQLFHVLHPYGHPECVMNPVPMFGYRAWAAKLNGKACPLGITPEMVPGVYKILYDD
jgi:hypothetical protein